MLFDTLMNLVTRMGTRGDKATGSQFTFTRMSDNELLDAYRGDFLARKIVDIPAEDAVREWRAWQADKPQIEKLEEEEKRLAVAATVTAARILARLFGGAGLIIGANTDRPEDELRPEDVGVGGIEYLMALPRQKLTSGERIWTPGPLYGLPGSYTINSSNGQTVTLHHSRVVRFTGSPIPLTEVDDMSGWGDSVLDAARDALVAAGTSLQAVSSLMQEAKVDVIGIPRLMELVSTERDKEKLLARFNIAGITKSLHNQLLKDANETWEQKQISFAQMPELIDRFLQIVSGAADIPATRLLGQSPAGMNSTGESDLVNYYDRLASEQTNEITPALRPLDEMLIRSALGSRPPEVHYTWRPLWQMRPKEKAEIGKLKAETLQIHKNSRLIPDAALADGLVNQLVEDGIYPGIEQAIADAEAAGDLAGFEQPDPITGIDPKTGKVDPAIAAQQDKVQRQMPQSSPRQPIPQQRAANDAAPRPLYVSRPVVNAEELIQWAREQGFKTTLPADQLHVTVAYSKRPVDWASLEPQQDVINADRRDAEGRETYRWVAKLGEDGAVILMFECKELRDRWQAIIDAGASWDFDHYWPHVTISYDAGEYLEAWLLNPFMGVIELGPERFDTLGGSDEPVREVSTEGGTR